MIDKDLKPAVHFMISNTYAPVIMRVIAMYVVKDIDEIRHTVKFSVPKGMSGTEIFKLRNHLIQEVLCSDKAQQSLQFGLKKVSQLKEDIIKEILRQYAIDKNDDSTDYHDMMCEVFASHCITVASLLEQRNFKAIRELTEIKE